MDQNHLIDMKRGKTHKFINWKHYIQEPASNELYRIMQPSKPKELIEMKRMTLRNGKLMRQLTFRLEKELKSCIKKRLFKPEQR